MKLRYQGSEGKAQRAWLSLPISIFGEAPSADGGAELVAAYVHQQRPGAAEYPRGCKAEQQRRQVERMENVSLSDKAIQRLIEFLSRAGWTDKQILDLINYLTK